MFVDNEDCNQHIVLDTAGLNITSPGAFLVSLETIFSSTKPTNFITKQGYNK